MKKAKFIWAFMVFCMGLAGTFSSCSDKDGEPIVPAAKKIAGTYTGDITCNVLNTTYSCEDLTVTLEATDNATVVVSIPSFGVNGHNTLPAFDIPAVKVSGDNGVYEIATTEFSGTNDAGQAYSGILQGNLTDGILSLVFTLHIGVMPMPMTCRFISTVN